MRCYLLNLSQTVATYLVLIGYSSNCLSQTWTGLGDGETWLDGSNWDAGIAPQVPGDVAIFDANFGIPQVPIQVSGPISVGAVNMLNGPGNVVIADDEPLHPYLPFVFDNAGVTVQIDLDFVPGNSITFARSLSQLQFNDDVEVSHQGTPADVFRIDANVFGGKSLSLLPGNGRVELTGSSFQLDNLAVEQNARLGDNTSFTAQDVFSMAGDFKISPTGSVQTPAYVQSAGTFSNDGFLMIEPGGFVNANGGFVGTGQTEVHRFSTLRGLGPNGYSGSIQLFGGTVSVSAPFGGPVGTVKLQDYSTIATNDPTYDPTLDPAIVVDSSVTTPGNIGFSIDNIPGYSAPIDLNFNNGVDNSYRLGSNSLSIIPLGTTITPFDNGAIAVYYLGGTGTLQVDAQLTDSLSGIVTALHMPAFPQAEFGVNTGSIILNSFNTFSGPVNVEQEQLVLAHPLAVQFAASLDITAQSSIYTGGNYSHGTIVLDPALIGSYAGQAPELRGGALGFTSSYAINTLPTNSGLLSPATFDASGFDGGSPMSNLLALGAGHITQAAGFLLDNSLDPNGNPVVLITTDQAFVQLTHPNFHSGGTAVVGHSRLEIDDGAELGTGPLNIANEATLSITNTTVIYNNLDFHDAFAFGNSTIEVSAGQSVAFAGNMSTADSMQATITKAGDGRMVFKPSSPWSPLGGENSWGVRLVRGDLVLNQLPEYDPGIGDWSTGPLILDNGFFPASLNVTSSTQATAANPDNAGFRVLHSVGSSMVPVTVDPGAELRVAGVGQHNEVLGRIDKLGKGTLWFGGDSSGGDAVGSSYEGRGDLNIVEGTVRFGNLLGTNDAARAFPDDMIVRIQDQAILIKEQDQPGQLHSLYVNDQSGLGVAEVHLFGGFSPLGDGSLNVDLDANGTFDITGLLIKNGNAPLRFRAQPGATVKINPAALQIDDGIIEVDGSGIDPFTDTVTGNSLAVTSNTTTGGLLVTSGNVRIQQLSGSGRTRIEAGAKLEIVSPIPTQNVFEVNGELQAPGAFPIVIVKELLTGRGIVTGDLQLNGPSVALAPNDDINPTAPTPATLKITGNLTMSPGDELNIDIDGATVTNDFVDLGGKANLDGALTLDVHSPFNALGSFSFTILGAAGGIPSQFNSTPAPGNYLGAGVEFAGITYGPNDITVDLMQTAYADFNEDQVVDTADLVAWQANYGTSGTGIHALGDADLDGDVDGRDFLIWQRQVGTVFPVLPSITPSNVPEPSTLWLMLSCGTLLARYGHGRRLYRISP